VATIQQLDYLATLKAAGQFHTFTRIAQKMYYEKRPDGAFRVDRLNGVLFELARREYEKIKNDPSKVAQATFRPHPNMEEALVKDAPEKDDPDGELKWPFRVSRESAAAQLREIHDKEASFYYEVEWIAKNLSNIEAQPNDAPSAKAWELLVTSVQNAKSREMFFDKYYFRVRMKEEKDEETSRDREQNYAKQLTMLDRVAADPTCPHCGAELYATHE
jgi:hypothetical protein